MPTRTFSTSSLDGAMPGLSRLAMALGGGDQAYQAGFNQGGTNQSRMAQALAQIQHAKAATAAAEAQAGKYGAEADQQRAETNLLNQRPDQYQQQAALASGTSLPLVRAVLEATKTGQPAAFDDVGPEPDGSALRTPVPADVQSKISRALLQYAPVAMNGKDFKIDDWAGAQGAFRNQNLGDDVLAGTRSAGAVGASQAAVAGKPLFNAEANGGVLDLFGGGLDTNNPMAKSTIGLKGAQAGQANAAAAEHAAGAGLKKQQTELGAKGQFDASSGMLIDPRTGTAKPVVGPDGKPIGGKAASLNQEQANALTFASRMQAADGILAKLAAGSVTQPGVTQPGLFRRGASALPWVGDAAGAAANFTQSEPQQQVEQAQRDFINAVLRRESGAAISSGEFSNAAQQYFPQPGDKPAVLTQKAEARKRVIQGMLAAVPEKSRTLPELPGATPRTVNVDY